MRIVLILFPSSLHKLYKKKQQKRKKPCHLPLAVDGVVFTHYDRIKCFPQEASAHLVSCNCHASL